MPHDRYGLHQPSRWRQASDAMIRGTAAFLLTMAFLSRLPGRLIAWPFAAVGHWLLDDFPDRAPPMRRALR